MKALVVRLSSIGDVVHAMPALEALYTHGWEVAWLVEPPARPLLEDQPMLSRVLSVPSARAFHARQARATLAALRACRFDVALDFQGLWKSAAWARASRAPRVIGYDRSWRREPLSRLLIRERFAMPPGVTHVIDENLALLRPLGIEAIGSRRFPPLTFPDAAARVERALENLGVRGEFVILNPGGGWSSKRWPSAHWAHLAAALRERGWTSLVTWGPGEESLVREIVDASQGAAMRCFPTTLRELVELVRRARLVVAADTGPLHLATAMATPVVGLYGPTPPQRNGPFAPADIALQARGVTEGSNRFRTRGAEMSSIPVSEVVDAAERRLRRPAREESRVV